MASWTPEQWNTFFIFAGGFIVLIATQLTNMIISLRNGKKADVTASKIDDNTQMTADIHKVTNGPLSNMEETVKGIVTQAATNAAIANAAVEAAKTQAVVDANRIPLAKSPEKP